MQHPHPAVRLRKGVADRAGAVLAAVVGKDQLKVRVLLAQDAFHAAAQSGLRIVHRDDDADARFHKKPPVLF